MNFDFSEDQKLLADQVKRFLDDNCTSATVRQVLDGDAAYAQEVWQGLAQMGLIGTAIPEEFGGTGAGYLELVQVAHQLGAHLAPVPFASTVYLVAEAILGLGSQAQKEAWLGKIAQGEVKGALVVPDTNQVQVTDGQITGEVAIVTDGSIADLFLVALESGLYLVPRADGVSTEKVSTIDLSRDAAAVTFTGAAAELLIADGRANLDWLYNRAAVLFAFEQLGGAQAALDMAVNYSQERFAFGRPIATFQALKHMMADMYVAMKLAENNCYYAAWALANDAPDLSLAAATARVGATQAFQLCAKDNIQVHGGMGFTWEFDCHLYYRRSNDLALEMGGLSQWENKLVDALPLAALA